MKSIKLAAVPALAFCAASSEAQYPIVNDIIAQTIMGVGSGLPDTCYTKWTPKPANSVAAKDGAEPALRAYLAVAAVSGDLTPVTSHRKSERRWAIDGADVPLASVRDPWAARIAKLTPQGFQLSNLETRARAVFRAYAADGTELGTYDVLTRKKGKGWRVSTLDLYSPGSTAGPKPITAFCDVPGDVEKFKEAVAKQEAEKAAKRRAKEAERAARAAN